MQDPGLHTGDAGSPATLGQPGMNARRAVVAASGAATKDAPTPRGSEREPLRSSTTDAPPTNPIVLLLAVFCWYAAATGAAVLTKDALKGMEVSGLAEGAPRWAIGCVAILLLTGLQGVATVVGGVIVRRTMLLSTPEAALGGDRATALGSLVAVFRGDWSHVRVVAQALPGVAWRIVTMHFLGNITTNAATFFTSSGAVQAIKVMEPVFAMVVGKEPLTPRRICVVLMVIIGGLACAGSLSQAEASVPHPGGPEKHDRPTDAGWLPPVSAAAVAGICLALLSNLGFSTRNVASKRLMQQAHISIHGQVVLMAASLCTAVVSLALAAVLVPLLGWQAAKAAAFGSVAYYFWTTGAASALGFAGYNVSSFFVLQMVTPLTHALLNVGKRIIIVVLSSWYFGATLSGKTILSLLFLVAGLSLHDDKLVGLLSARCDRHIPYLPLSGAGASSVAPVTGPAGSIGNIAAVARRSKLALCALFTIFSIGALVALKAVAPGGSTVLGPSANKVMLAAVTSNTGGKGAAALATEDRVVDVRAPDPAGVVEPLFDTTGSATGGKGGSTHTAGTCLGPSSTFPHSALQMCLRCNLLGVPKACPAGRPHASFIAVDDAVAKVATQALQGVGRGDARSELRVVVAPLPPVLPSAFDGDWSEYTTPVKGGTMGGHCKGSGSGTTSKPGSAPQPAYLVKELEQPYLSMCGAAAVLCAPFDTVCVTLGVGARVPVYLVPTDGSAAPGTTATELRPDLASRYTLGTLSDFINDASGGHPPAAAGKKKAAPAPDTPRAPPHRAITPGDVNRNFDGWMAQYTTPMTDAAGDRPPEALFTLPSSRRLLQYTWFPGKNVSCTPELPQRGNLGDSYGAWVLPHFHPQLKMYLCPSVYHLRKALKAGPAALSKAEAAALAAQAPTAPGTMHLPLGSLADFVLQEPGAVLMGAGMRGIPVVDLQGKPLPLTKVWGDSDAPGWDPGSPTLYPPLKAWALGVRGPRSRDVLLGRYGVNAAVVGDAGVLAPAIFPRARPPAAEQHPVCFILHYSDAADFATHAPHLKPVVSMTAGSLDGLFDLLANCARVASSSLHGVIFAHAFGIPALAFKTATSSEDDFKYVDYYNSVGVYSFDARPVPPSLALPNRGTVGSWAADVDAAPQPVLPADTFKTAQFFSQFRLEGETSGSS